MNGFAKLTVVALCALGGASTAFAQQDGPAPPSPEQLAANAVKVRQGLLEVINWSFSGHVGAMLRNKEPFDAAAFQKSAERVKGLAPMIPEAFKYDTRSFKVTTKAKENIWTNLGDFSSKADELAKAAAALEEAAKGGDKATTLKAAGALGKTCGNCHDNYREK